MIEAEFSAGPNSPPGINQLSKKIHNSISECYPKMDCDVHFIRIGFKWTTSSFLFFLFLRFCFGFFVCGKNKLYLWHTEAVQDPAGFGLCEKVGTHLAKWRWSYCRDLYLWSDFIFSLFLFFSPLSL